MTKPLVIFIGEQHDNMAYGSLMENLAKYSETRDLNVQIFSEYKSQTQKIKLEEKLGEPLRNVANNQETFAETTKFLDNRFIAMETSYERDEMVARHLKEYQDQGLTPRQLFEQNAAKGLINPQPEIIAMMENEITAGEEKAKKNGTVFALDDFYPNYRSTLHYGEIHNEMVGNLRAEKKDNTDVVIIVAGYGHTYGLNQKLESDFQDCQKFVITNFLDQLPDQEMASEIRRTETTQTIGVGGLLKFDIDPITREASIPDIVRIAIDEKSQAKGKSAVNGVPQKEMEGDGEKSFVEKLGLEKTDQTKSFVERMRSDKTQGKSLGGFNEL